MQRRRRFDGLQQQQQQQLYLLINFHQTAGRQWQQRALELLTKDDGDAAPRPPNV